MQDLLINLYDSLALFVVAVWQVVIALLSIVLHWAPLMAWIAFWLFAVDWTKLRQTMLQGGWIGAVLIGLVMILIWGVVAPPPDGTHYLLGLTVSNFVGKGVYVTGLFCIMFLCGAVQLAGGLPACCRVNEESADDAI